LVNRSWQSWVERSSFIWTLDRDVALRRRTRKTPNPPFLLFHARSPPPNLVSLRISHRIPDPPPDRPSLEKGTALLFMSSQLSYLCPPRIGVSPLRKSDRNSRFITESKFIFLSALLGEGTGLIPIRCTATLRGDPRA
jgi:hypothetical protein